MCNPAGASAISIVHLKDRFPDIMRFVVIRMLETNDISPVTPVPKWDKELKKK
jgi:hypothetical protein